MSLYPLSHFLPSGIGDPEKQTVDSVLGVRRAVGDEEGQPLPPLWPFHSAGILILEAGLGCCCWRLRERAGGICPGVNQKARPVGKVSSHLLTAGELGSSPAQLSHRPPQEPGSSPRASLLFTVSVSSSDLGFPFGAGLVLR